MGAKVRDPSACDGDRCPNRAVTSWRCPNGGTIEGFTEGALDGAGVSDECGGGASQAAIRDVLRRRGRGSGRTREGVEAVAEASEDVAEARTAGRHAIDGTAAPYRRSPRHREPNNRGEWPILCRAGGTKSC